MSDAPDTEPTDEPDEDDIEFGDGDEDYDAGDDE